MKIRTLPIHRCKSFVERYHKKVYGFDSPGCSMFIKAQTVLLSDLELAHVSSAATEFYVASFVFHAIKLRGFQIVSQRCRLCASAGTSSLTDCTGPAPANRTSVRLPRGQTRPASSVPLLSRVCCQVWH